MSGESENEQSKLLKSENHRDGGDENGNLDEEEMSLSKNSMFVVKRETQSRG